MVGQLARVAIGSVQDVLGWHYSSVSSEGFD